MGSAEMRDTDVLSTRGGPDMALPEATEQGPWAGVGLPSARGCISFCTFLSSRYTCTCSAGVILRSCSERVPY